MKKILISGIMVALCLVVTFTFTGCKGASGKTVYDNYVEIAKKYDTVIDARENIDGVDNENYLHFNINFIGDNINKGVEFKKIYNKYNPILKSSTLFFEQNIRLLLTENDNFDQDILGKANTKLVSLEKAIKSFAEAKSDLEIWDGNYVETSAIVINSLQTLETQYKNLTKEMISFSYDFIDAYDTVVKKIDYSTLKSTDVISIGGINNIYGRHILPLIECYLSRNVVTDIFVNGLDTGYESLLEYIIALKSQLTTVSTSTDILKVAIQDLQYTSNVVLGIKDNVINVSNEVEEAVGESTKALANEKLESIKFTDVELYAKYQYLKDFYVKDYTLAINALQNILQ